MTSQKRYRHHQDNSSSTSRHRDLPPRFKRQKSSTSPTPAEPNLSPTSAPEPHKNSPVEKATQRLLSPHSAAPYSTMPRAPSPQLFVDQPVNEARSRADILQTPQTVKVGVWPWPDNTARTQAQVLGQMDNFYYSPSPQSPHVSHVTLGTHFGFRTTSPPVSPWGASAMTGQPSSYHSPWMSGQSGQFRSQQSDNSSNFVFNNNENRVPSQNLRPQFNPHSPWGRPAFTSQQQSSPSPPVENHSTSGHPDNSKEKGSNNRAKNENDVKRAVDYSDPDIRTIEMLRELERVADEKESEGDDFGTDRKSLVSHHLRMLMCAVDRYTEGVEDDMNPRNDEVFTTTDSPALTPGPSPGPKETTKSNGIESETGLYCNSPSLWRDVPTQPAVSAHTGFVEVPTQRCDLLMSSSPQASLAWGEQERRPQEPEIPAWDPWSSPYFDMTGDVFSFAEDSGSDKKHKERKPLYQR